MAHRSVLRKENTHIEKEDNPPSQIAARAIKLHIIVRFITKQLRKRPMKLSQFFWYDRPCHSSIMPLVFQIMLA